MSMTEDQLLAIGRACDIYEDDPEEAEAMLQHYGVKGMKWGIRREQERLDISQVPTQELQQIVNRMNLENNYARLTQGTHNDLGQQFVKKYQNQLMSGLAVSAGAGTMAILSKSPEIARFMGRLIVKGFLRAAGG